MIAAIIIENKKLTWIFHQILAHPKASLASLQYEICEASMCLLFHYWASSYFFPQLTPGYQKPYLETCTD